MRTSTKWIAAGMTAATGLCMALSPALAQTQSAQQMQDQQMAQIPQCAKPIGTLAVYEPESGISWFAEQQLPSPTKLIKVIVSKSNCFILLDRGAGMDVAMRERQLASSGELQGQSNLGKGQVKAADYVLVPDLVSRNNNAGGSSIGSVLGGLLGHSKFGALAGNINLSTKTADVTLTLTDVRSSQQVAMTEGNAKKTDIGFGANANLWGSSGFGGADVGGYANTSIGQVVTLAYLQAYNKMVSQLGALSGHVQGEAQQAVTVTRPARLLSSPEGGAAVRSLDPGMMLYPTGRKQGLMWEVKDEMGNLGWVSSESLQLSR